MTRPLDKTADQRLLDAILAYVANHGDGKMDRFREPVANWGTDWHSVAPAHLPASDILEQCLALTNPDTRGLMDSLVRERASRNWEQSYTKSDKAVGDDMLAKYGFAEIIGERGPFVSARVRAGIGVFGKGINYPPHRHQAEEIYVVLAGSADFRFGDTAPAKYSVGNLIHVPPQMIHGFTTGKEPLVVFYLWKGGDLREKSTFVSAQ